MTDSDITTSTPTTISRATGTTTGGSMQPSPLSSIGAAPILGIGNRDAQKMTQPDLAHGKADRNPPKFEETMHDMRAGMSPNQMRQGVTGQGVRAVLVVSTVGALLAMAVVYFFIVP